MGIKTAIVGDKRQDQTSMFIVRNIYKPLILLTLWDRINPVDFDGVGNAICRRWQIAK